MVKFGDTPISQVKGTILAHSLALANTRLKKGRVLTDRDVEILLTEGVESAVTAKLEDGDLDEDTAAAAVAHAIAPDEGVSGILVAAPFAGRVNLYAARQGLFVFPKLMVDTVNSVDEAVTLATLPDNTWVRERQMIGTVKVIPYGVAGQMVSAICSKLNVPSAPMAEVCAPVVKSCDVILTKLNGTRKRVLDKGLQAVEARLSDRGVALARSVVTPHISSDVAACLRRSDADMSIILPISATSDRGDVAPAAIIEAGGRIERFGMPVDPGNLLVLGERAGAPVVGLPGCARSPALNGADLVLNALIAGVSLTSAAIAAMGSGGLLKEIPCRPTPRAARLTPHQPKISIILLAAGASRRFGDSHKLLSKIDGEPLVRRVTRRLCETVGPVTSECVVVVGAREAEIRRACAGLACRFISAVNWRNGMGASLRAGLAAIDSEADGVLVALADMPDVDSALVKRVVAAFAPAESREIVRPVFQGLAGHPVLFGRRFFESLAAADGDIGAREIIREHSDWLVEAPVHDNACVVDIDTVQALDAYRRQQTD
jgi:molybdenum cofactor cytidylyltransferase